MNLSVFLAGLVLGAVLMALVALGFGLRARRREARRLSALAHDLRAPLASITAYTEILQDDDEPETRARFLEIIHDEAARMLSAIATRLVAGAHSRAPVTSQKLPDPTRAGRAATPPGRTVLVVDDDRYIVEATRTLLAREGFEAHGAGGGEEALHHARREHPDVILMDLTMPAMGGDEALRKLRSDPATRDIPVIITTGAADAPAPEGAAAVLTKPISRSDLLATVGRVLNGT